LFFFEEQKTRSALLLEQAAYAFLEIKKSPTQAKVMVRKYALHLLLCAHLYKQADQVNKLPFISDYPLFHTCIHTFGVQ
jgi:hypothetical protein